MNVHESAQICSFLLSQGHTPAQSAETADILVFNTCKIRNTAEQKILTHIAQARKLAKKQSRTQEIIVTGCLTDQNYKDVSKDISVSQSITISYGCENFCAYCIVPYVRGREIHRPKQDILAEFDAVTRTGTVWLLGQNVNSHPDFIELLDTLCARKGDFKINFMSSHPKDFTTELIDCIARNAKIERNIHLPLQSGCDKILKAMNRRYTVAEYTAKIEYLRKRVPDICITTDIICGFPGETEEDFLQTVETMKKLRFNAAFIFPYSRRTGTAADKMPDQIDTATKKRRTTELVNLMRNSSRLPFPSQS